MSFWLLQIETKKGEVVGKVLSAPSDELKAATVEKLTSADKSLRFTMQVKVPNATIDVPVAVYFPEKEANPKVLRGMMTLNGQQLFAHLERTEEKELDGEKARDEGASPLIMKALRTRDGAEQEKLFKEVIAANPDKPAAYFGGLGLLSAMVKQGAPIDDLRKSTDAAIQVAALYGPELNQNAVAELAKVLIATEKSAPLAVEYARQSEKKLTDADPPAAAVSILKTLATALRKSGKADEATQLGPRIAKLEETLDAEFLKDAVPFKPKAYGGRAGENNRVVLVELFTGAQCPPCVAADVAFDGLLKTYKPSDVVFLQYHLHIPGPDPLTNEDSEKRMKYYDLGGTPSYYVDGQAGPPAGGPKQGGQQAYAKLFSKIGDELKTETKTAIKLTAQRKGDKIDIAAQVSGLENTGEKVRLRYVLVEDVVRYLGRNGQRLHHHVVRAFPGGVEGAKLDKAESKHEQSIQIPELTKTLGDYLTASNAKRPFIDDERPLSLKHLKVVAFIQNDEDKKVIQAAQVEVEEAK
jgi:hypothetical protein